MLNLFRTFRKNKKGGDTLERISFIGMGDLGTPMAVRLLEAGYQVTVYNRTAIRADEITNRGGIWAE
ncbi:MAG: NAD(P)-binding domain-containing protein, partial [Lachnospiraceae bacterium]|nr:NAD(P)-binding domain-containing protein [Lachnospiraceae bacterium]